MPQTPVNPVPFCASFGHNLACLLLALLSVILELLLVETLLHEKMWYL